VFTPGSAMRHGQAFFQAALEACARLSCRGIFLTMHPEQLPAALPAGIRHFSYVPFSAVFPRCAAVVHHGGIGTTAQGLAAGVPQLIMPMGFDQPDNAARLEHLGVGAALAVKRFAGPNLAAALERLLRPPIRQRCQEIASRLQNQNTLAATCNWIEQTGRQSASPVERRG
jgi:rhamnosyltransferase subunit B